MLDYNEVKRFQAKKLLEDLEGTGRVESAHYHTMKMVYDAGVRDGLAAAGLSPEEIRKVIGIIDHKEPPLKVPAGYTEEELERDNPHNAWMQHSDDQCAACGAVTTMWGAEHAPTCPNLPL